MEKQHRREEARKEKEAAKLKAANERALAKRLAKEMTDLIDDEQLELMEAAAATSALNLGILEGASSLTLDASQSACCYLLSCLLFLLAICMLLSIAA